MALKFTVLILLIAMIASLFTGFFFLIKDRNDSRMRLVIALGIRISLATVLIGTLAYGIMTGQLGSNAPWDQELHPERVIQPR